MTGRLWFKVADSKFTMCQPFLGTWVQKSTLSSYCDREDDCLVPFLTSSDRTRRKTVYICSFLLFKWYFIELWLFGNITMLNSISANTCTSVRNGLSSRAILADWLYKIVCHKGPYWAPFSLQLFLFVQQCALQI